MATYIIAMDPSVHADATAAQGAITDQGGTITKTYGFSLTYKVDCEAAELTEITGVLFSEDYSTSATVTGAFNTDHLKRLCNNNAETSVSYNPTSTGSGEHVYLVDTGVNTTHDEFTGATVNNLYSAFVDGDSNPVYTDTDGHGTGMASLIVGQNIGTAKDATVHNVRAMDSENFSGTIGAMVDALDACLVHHLANTPAQTKVVCVCWTTAKNNLLEAQSATLPIANSLKLLLGLDINAVIELTEPLILMKDEVFFKAEMEQLLQNNSKLKQLETTIELNENQLQLVKSMYYRKSEQFLLHFFGDSGIGRIIWNIQIP